MSSAHDEDASLAELARQNAALVAEIARLREERVSLSSQLAGAVLGMRADRESRRAALNLLEDASEARQSLQQSQRALQEAAIQARAAQAAAERANRAKDEFLATLSHELRTPLAAILLWASALKSGAVPPEDASIAIDAIVNSAKGQSRLIEDLLDLSRLSSGHFQLTLDIVSIGDVIRAAVDVVRAAADVKAIHLEIDVPPDLGLADVDAIRIQQVVWNLLTNAIKFTDRGGHVKLVASGTDTSIQLTLTDNGDGISAEFLPQMFERFRQADMEDTRQYGGLGIGLALCRSIVGLHQGTVEASSDGLGRGARFVVTLPRGDVTGVAPAAEAEPVDLRLDNVRVVLVENDDSTREAMQRNLEQLGAEVVPMRSGPEALKLFASGAAPPGARTSVLLCEISLPGMSGYELIQELAAQSEAKGTTLVPACAVSGHAREVDRHRAIAAGFDFHLAKPITRERLLAAVDDLRAIALSRSP